MRDVWFIVSVVFILAISALFAWRFLDEFANAPTLLAIPEVATTFSPMVKAQTSLTTTFDTLFILLFVGMYLGAMYLGHLLPTRPIYFVPFTIVLLFLLIMTAQVSNIWYEISTHTELSNARSQFFFIPLIMDGLPYYATIMAFILAIVIYTNVPTEGQTYAY